MGVFSTSLRATIDSRVLETWVCDSKWSIQVQVGLRQLEEFKRCQSLLARDTLSRATNSKMHHIRVKKKLEGSTSPFTCPATMSNSSSPIWKAWSWYHVIMPMCKFMPLERKTAVILFCGGFCDFASSFRLFFSSCPPSCISFLSCAFELRPRHIVRGSVTQIPSARTGPVEVGVDSKEHAALAWL